MHRVLLVVCLLAGCGLGAGALAPNHGGRTGSIGSSSTCSNGRGQVGRCGSDYTMNRSDSEGFDYETGGSFGARFGWHYGKGIAKTGDTSSTGTAFDLGLEFLLHSGRRSYGVEIGFSRQQLPEFGEGHRFTGFYFLPRLHYLLTELLQVHVGAAYLGLGTVDLPMAFGTEYSGWRVAGGLRFSIPIGLGYLESFVLTAEGQHTGSFRDIDYSANAFVGGVTAVFAP